VSDEAWSRAPDAAELGGTNDGERLDLSPSLVRAGRGAPSAYEWKFLVDEALALRIEDTLRDSLMVDPHGDERFGGAYPVTTIYFDTPNQDVLRGLGRHKLRKYRLRRYGDALEYFLERKTKQGTRVRKRRDAVTEDRLATAMGIGGDASPEHSPGWFGRQVARQQLRPTCRIQYLRRAYYGANSEGRLRLTFDRDLRGALVDGWSMRVVGPDVPILTDRVVCEFKFVQTMPSLFKRVIQDLQLLVSGYSKYRNGMRIFGTDAATPGTENAPRDESSREGHA
jgi:hypothetical protein